MSSYQPCRDLSESAGITYNNMHSYYAHYGVDWEQPKILEQISELDNWDILSDGEVIGAFRLAFDSSTCYLRDLQVCQNFQNQGIGAVALAEAIRLAKRQGATKLKLKVFKISPAYRLYIRSGFTCNNEDERFYYMAHNIT
ncbi:GNAT family N-acetyltransferase [Thalassotalea eurytherma]|uniref:N-acetyltransferase domain-containing protein n=1 Tax=Thalassotalea eurytherma TaxID=1144278 RepID=A0ABQ6H6B6_9GAMM|nr:GNAT family N-acetyltransferase [Thalassotalea eurytherma]GLX83698.1 hypothetical protein theurythT_31510 [Thalassotalea eurytherma]